MKTYSAVRAEIDKLERKAAALRGREIKGVIAKMKHAIAVYDLTAADLGLAGKSIAVNGKGKAKPVARASRSIGVAKYRDPATGDTWTGRGRPPTWIVKAANRDDFLIAASAGTAADSGKKVRASKQGQTPS